MIDAECSLCGAEGAHPVVHDDGWAVTASCRSCFAYMHVVLYDNNQEVPNRAKD